MLACALMLLDGEPYRKAGAFAALDMADADFPHLFKVVADFDDSVSRDVAGYAFAFGLRVKRGRYFVNVATSR